MFRITANHADIRAAIGVIVSYDPPHKIPPYEIVPPSSMKSGAMTPATAFG